MPFLAWRRALPLLLLTAGTAARSESALEFLAQPARGAYRLNVDEGFARDNVAQGYGLLREILDGDYDLLTDPRTAGLDVVAVMWGLYDAAARKGQAYDQGSFMVEDRHGRLTQFLLVNDQAAPRHSSHLRRATRLTGQGHYGIDILGAYDAGARLWNPFTDQHPAFQQLNILPARKGTLLVIPMPADARIGLETRHVFIKMEDHGLRTWNGWFNHALDFLTRTLLGWEEVGVSRKERVHPRFTRAYAAMAAALPQGQRDRLNPDAPELGLRVMRAQAEAVAGMPAGAEARCRALDFLRLVDGENLDHLNVRTGHEVVLSESELRGAMGIHRVARAAGEGWTLDLPANPACPAATPAPAPAPAGWRAWLGW